MPIYAYQICYNFARMILVTGGTGFIGSHLVNQLTANGLPVRLLLNPSKETPNIIKGQNVEVTLSSLIDERGLRSALNDVDVIYHLATAEQLGSRADLMKVEIEGTKVISSLAKAAGVTHFIYVSHIGADRASAFPLLQAKGIAEHFIKESNINYTIIRSAIVFGKGDNFTINLVKLIKKSPGFLFLPGDGNTLIQPLWIDDLVASLIWTLDIKEIINRTIEIGGPEYLSIKEVIKTLINTLMVKRALFEISPVYLKTLTEFLEIFNKKFPTSVFWLDYLAENRICDIDSITRYFQITPARFSHHLDHL